jgi:hypothetical protein
MQLPERNSALEIKRLKLAFGELLIKKDPSHSVSQPKYAIA